MEQEVDKIKKEIWNNLDFLRSVGDGQEVYHVILFLLVLKKLGSLPKFKVMRQLEDLHLNLEVKVMAVDDPEFTECFERVYEPLIEKIGNSTLSILISGIKDINIESPEAFEEVFEWLLIKITESFGRAGGENLLPKDLSTFMANLIDVPEKSMVYNPFAGLGSFGIPLKDDVTFVGQEIDELVWAQAILRRKAFEKENGYFLLEDSLNNWVYNTKFDLIISAPPFGKIKKFNNSIDLNIKSCDEFVVNRGIDSLKGDGKLVVLVSEPLLGGPGAYLSLRERLIEGDLVEIIISLPAGILMPFSNVKASILVLNKGKSNKGNISMVDGSHFELKESKGSRFNYAEVNSLVTKSEKGKGLLIISNEKVSNQQYNLEVSRYFLQEELQEKEELAPHITLSEILSEVRGGYRSGDLELRLVSIKHLAKDYLNYKLDLSGTEYAEGAVKNVRIIDRSCLLVAKIGNDLKPTYFDYKKEQLAVTNNVMAFQVDEKLVDLDFLINELYSESTSKQLEVFRGGVAQQSISKTDFLQLRIPLPSLEEQKSIMKGVKEAFIKARLKEVELQKELLGFKDEAFREFASIKHTFRQYLNALKSNVSGTRKFIANNEGNNITLDTVYSKNLNRTLGEHLASLEGTIDSMSSLITEETVDQGKAEILSPEELIKEAQNRFKDPDKFRFEEVFVDHEVFASEEGYMNPFIKITKDGFFRIFSNIVYNAVDHGFKDRTGNLIRTAISFEEETRFVLVEISNNGWPIPEAFTQKHLTTRGEKTSDSKGTGSGGADIKGILEKYNAKLELKKDAEAEFPVIYVLKFPLFTWLDKMGPSFLDGFNPDDFDILK